jgi:hypothetical protein
MNNGASVSGLSHCTRPINMYVLVIVGQIRKSVNHLLADYQPRGRPNFLPDFCPKFRER